MIEYALLFGLGFVAAVLVILLVAPAIHGRIVKFTEERLEATMPFSPQEVRAQKDMVRAEMAVLLAKTGQNLRDERHKTGDYQIRNDALFREVNRLSAENYDLKHQVDALYHDAGEMRAVLRGQEFQTDRIRLQLAEVKQEGRNKQERIERLDHKVQLTLSELDNMRIDLATRDTESESLKARINFLRDERDILRTDLRNITQRAKDAELRLAREENKVQRLDERNNRERMLNADREIMIERNNNEIARLKLRLKTASAEARDASRLLKGAGIARPQTVKISRTGANDGADADTVIEIQSLLAASQSPVVEAPKVDTMTDKDALRLTDDVRNQALALSERLMNVPNGSQDEKMRVEIADIAAKLIAVTAHREGPSSLIHAMLTGKSAQGTSSRISLGERAAKILHPATDA